VTLSKVQPKHIRYIKLGDGGRWAQQSLSEGVLCFGYQTIPHDVCERKDWDEVRNLLFDRKSEGAKTAGVTEVKAFYELGEDCLWITFADGHLWWAFAHPEVQWTGNDDPSRKRVTLDGWRSTDILGKPLRASGLSSKLTKIANFRATICTVAEEDYLLRRISGIEEPIVARANEARKAMMVVAVEMIRGLHWADFETLTDLIFARSGWQRSTRVGENLTDIDLVMEQPTTGETAFVQVKSEAGQATVDDYLGRFRRSGYDRFFFVCHSAQGKLTLPDEPRLHLFEGERLADAAVKNGLYDWLIERSG
jgi:Restriction endonuclease